MSWIRMNIQNGALNGEMEMDQASHEHKADLIKGFFEVFGVAKSKQEVVGIDWAGKGKGSQTVVSIDEIKPKLPASSEIRKTIETAIKKKTEPPKVIKPPLLNSERSLTVPIGEKLAAAAESSEQQPEWYKTGIKYKDGVPHYRCRYWCKNPDCRDKSNDYIEGHEPEIKCRKCGQRLIVRQATEIRMQRDEWGNFFIADRPAEV
ncbi:hypothetical protein [Paenibacillus apiarius]|uniref:hypothetical protein n=1 Tax=Paenibacillus apiarius TaxID=46240 RepID=UPI003B3A92EF